jgi:hypothetical protein
MPSIIACFSPNDTLLVNQVAVIRIVEYSDPAVTLEVLPTADAQPLTLSVGSEWSKIFGALEMRYRGIFVNQNCQPARRAGIEFRDTEAIDVRLHSFAGVLVRDPPRMGGKRPPGGAH